MGGLQRLMKERNEPAMHISDNIARTEMRSIWKITLSSISSNNKRVRCRERRFCHVSHPLPDPDELTFVANKIVSSHIPL